MSSELESDVCYRVYGWCYLVKATKVTTGLGDSKPTATELQRRDLLPDKLDVQAGTVQAACC